MCGPGIPLYLLVEEDLSGKKSKPNNLLLTWGHFRTHLVGMKEFDRFPWHNRRDWDILTSAVQCMDIVDSSESLVGDTDPVTITQITGFIGLLSAHNQISTTAEKIIWHLWKGEDP